jgi:AmmeMemoRadiSam system protein A
VLDCCCRRRFETGGIALDTKKLKRLLPLARWALERWVEREPWETGGPCPAPEEDCPIDGLFVTLKIEGGLRGCIGKIGEQPSLEQAVRELSIQSAAHDPRFTPVQREELPLIDISLSMLTPAEALEDPESIEIGRDGLIIERGSRRGLLLPEVAEEFGWDRWRFLEEICEKAFLPRDAWRDPACRLYRFRTVQVSESSD